MSLVTERPVSGPPHYKGHGGVSSAGSSSSRKISYGSAMTDFRKMFPTLEPSVIESVLRANGGLVEPTVEQLLAMCGKEFEEDFDQTSEDDSTGVTNGLLPGYYEACLNKQSPPPSYTSVQSHSDASTQTDETTGQCDKRIKLCTGTRCCSSPEHSNSSSVSDDSSCSGRRTMDSPRCPTREDSNTTTTDCASSPATCRRRDKEDKKALVLQNMELKRQLLRKQQIIDYLERNNSQRDHQKSHRHSDPVSLPYPVHGVMGSLTVPPSYCRTRRMQTLTVQRQQNPSPPPNATVGLDITDISLEHTGHFSRSQETRKSAKKRLQSITKRLLRRSGGSDVPIVSPASSSACLRPQETESSTGSGTDSYCHYST